MLKYRPRNYINLYRAETHEAIKANKLDPYTELETQVIYDPRSKRKVGHVFNSRDIFEVENVILEPKQGLLYSKQGFLIAESTNWSTSNLYESFPWNPRNNFKKLEVDKAINLTSNAFGHWLVEDIGSFLHLIEKYPNSPVLVYRNSSKYVYDLLKFLSKRVIFCDGPVEVKSILIITKQQDSGWMHPKDLENLKRFANGFLEKPSEQKYKIYATRRDLKRSPKNEIQIEKLFEKFGFTILQLEKLNFLDEIKLVSQTKVLAGVSGSWQFNCVWMNEGSQVVDIINESYWPELSHRVCTMCKINYSPYLYPGDFHSEINLEALEQFLSYELV